MVEATESLAPLRDWFREWNACLLAVDFSGARALFSPDVSGFGTHAEVVFGLDRLEFEQWRNVWPQIRDFHFEVERLHGAISGELAWAAVPWTSTGFHSDGTPFARPGRASVILRREGGHWLAIHTHVSLVPGTPPATFGSRGAS